MRSLGIVAWTAALYLAMIAIYFPGIGTMTMVQPGLQLWHMSGGATLLGGAVFLLWLIFRAVM